NRPIYKFWITWLVGKEVREAPARSLLDTGCTDFALSYDFVKAMKIPVHKRAERRVSRGWSGKDDEDDGVTGWYYTDFIRFSFGNHCTDVQFEVAWMARSSPFDIMVPAG